MKQSKKKKHKTQIASENKIYKKRHSIYERLNITVFMAAFFFTGLCLTFLERPEVSEIENRDLAEKPELTLKSYFDGSFADDFSVYFSDTVPFREKIVGFMSSFNKLKGISSPTFYGNVNIVADNSGNSVSTEPYIPSAPPSVTTAVTEAADDITEENGAADNGDENTVSETAVTTAPPESVTYEEITTTEEEEEVSNIGEFSNNGIVVDGVKMYGDNAGVMLFGGNNAAGTRYAQVISAYKETLGEDINVYNMVVPTSVEFYLPKRFRRYSSSEKDAIDHIYSSYTADIIPIDAYSEIAAHTDEYIYLRTDHHWSQRGAYYAYSAFAKALGQTPPDISKDYEEKTKEGFVGSLYNYTNDITLKNSPEIFTYYIPNSEFRTYYYDYITLQSMGQSVLFHEYVTGGSCYGMFIGSDAIHTRIETDLDTGRKLCVFKESYGNALVPYLVDSFDEIYVIDIRYFGRNAVEYIKEKGITDVLFINNIFAADTDSLIDGIEKLYTNPYGTLNSEKIAVAEAYYASLAPAATYTGTEAAVTSAVPAAEAPVTTEVPVTTETAAAQTAVITGGGDPNV